MAKKDNKKVSKKHKTRKVIIYSLVITLLIGVLSFIVLDILLSDKNRNTYKDKGLTNEEIINKEYVNGLSTMNEYFSFSLKEDDINQMLTNSTKSTGIPKYVDSVYYVNNNMNHMWCFDLNIPLITTRLIINTHIDSYNNSFVFWIDSMTIGKINARNILQRGGYISNDIFNSLFKNASLPITSSLENNYFIYEPLKFIDYFNLGEVTSELFTSLNTPSRLSVDNTSIGFKLNLEGISQVPLSPLLEEYNLIEELDSKVNNNTLFNSMNSFEETSILEVDENEFTCWIKDFFTKDLEIERVTSELINTYVSAKIHGVNVKFTNNELNIIWEIKLGNIYLNVQESLGISYDSDSFSVSFFRPVEESQLQLILMDDFITRLVTKGFATYSDNNRLLTFLFNEVNMTSNINFFTTKRVAIENNKLIFFITKLI